MAKLTEKDRAVRRAVRHMQKAHDELRRAQLSRLSFTDNNVPGEADPVRVTLRLRIAKKRGDRD